MTFIIGKAQDMGDSFIWRNKAQDIGYSIWLLKAQDIGYQLNFIGIYFHSNPVSFHRSYNRIW